MTCVRCDGFCVSLSFSEDGKEWYECLKCVNCGFYLWGSQYVGKHNRNSKSYSEMVVFKKRVSRMDG
jgi:hypothetical protein